LRKSFDPPDIRSLHSELTIPMRLLCIFFCATLSGLAQEPIVRLLLGTVGGRTQFQLGQEIKLTLTFETDNTQKVSIVTGVRRRHVRLQTPDEFSAEPATGWIDPLGDLTWTMEANDQLVMLQYGGNLDATHPVVVERSLNEFIVFRQPGHYVIHCKTERLRSERRTKVESNGLALDILPSDEAEKARQFASARATLEAGKPPKEPERVFYTAKENAQADAVRTLRYLDTEAAATYLASIYGQGRRTGDEIEYALLASEHRGSIVRELERRMADSDLTLTQSFLITLIQLKARLQESNPGHTLSQADWAALDETVNKRVFELAAAKTPEAKAGTYFYLFETGSKSFRGTPEMLRLVVETLPFASLFQIEVLLSNEWSEVRGAGPPLVRFLRQAVSHEWPQMSPSISGVALLRLAELDPKTANELATNALFSGELSIGDPELLEFSVPASPQLDQALLAQYQQGKPVESRIARFASPDIKDEVGRAWDARVVPRGTLQCATPLLAYFFRVDPTAAARRVADSRKAGTNPCMALRFYRMERRLMGPGLERQLIQDTTSSDPSIRLAAYQTLSLAGSPATLPELLQALEEATVSKQEIIAAILQGRNWLLKEADFARLAKECAGTLLCQEISRVKRESAPPYTLRLFNMFGHQGVWLSNHEVDSLADLDDKLTQYLLGAQFRWESGGASMSGEERDMRDRVQALLMKHGMTLLQ
jgi:hypothetical protein